MAGRFLVGDVEDGGHAVAVFRFEAASRELYALYHVGVDDGEPFLLSGGDEHRAIDFHAVDIDAVLVERPATDVVLRRELVVGGDTGLRGHQFLDGIAGGRGQTLQFLGREFLRGAHLAAHLADGDLAHLRAAGVHRDVPYELPLWTHQHLAAFLESDQAVANGHGISCLKLKAVTPFDIRDSADGLTFDLHGDEGQRSLLVVHDPTAEGAGRCRLCLHAVGQGSRLLCPHHLDGGAEEQQKQV